MPATRSVRTKSRAGRLAQQGGRQEEKVEEGGASSSIGAALAALARSRSPTPPAPARPSEGPPRPDPPRQHPSSHLRHSIAPASFLAAADSKSREPFPNPAKSFAATPSRPCTRRCYLAAPASSATFPSRPPSPSHSSLALLLPPSTAFSSIASFSNIYCIIPDFTYLRKPRRS